MPVLVMSEDDFSQDEIRRIQENFYEINEMCDFVRRK